ncbi:MAG: hypothetical protein J0H29_19060 [Sphingobacteriales bacterium]|nr:hypothetical protein [Sphingobacteriales bacterium]
MKTISSLSATLSNTILFTNAGCNSIKGRKPCLLHNLELRLKAATIA